MRSRRLAVVLVVLFATACTKSEAGQPSAGGPTSESTRPPSSGPPGSPAPTVAIPPRPKELKLDGLDPCSFFTKTQLSEIKIDRTRKTTDGSQQYKGMPKCQLDQNPAPFDHYSVTAVTNEGIGPWLTGKRNVEARLSSVAGYAAATYWIRGSNGHNADSCSTSVDVAGGQQLIIDADNGSDRLYTLEQLCQRAEQVGGFAVQTLQTLK